MSVLITVINHSVYKPFPSAKGKKKDIKNIKNSKVHEIPFKPTISLLKHQQHIISKLLHILPHQPQRLHFGVHTLASIYPFMVRLKFFNDEIIV